MPKNSKNKNKNSQKYEEPPLKKFIVPVSWRCGADLEIMATSEKEAIQLAYDAPLPDGECMADTFEVHDDIIEEHTDDLWN